MSLYDRNTIKMVAGSRRIAQPWERVYFIYSSVMDAIKIGYSNDPAGRLKALNTAVVGKLELLKAIHGTMEDEYAIQKQFKEYRLNGEWFRDVPELRKFIAEATAA